MLTMDLLRTVGVVEQTVPLSSVIDHTAIVKEDRRLAVLEPQSLKYVSAATEEMHSSGRLR